LEELGIESELNKEEYLFLLISCLPGFAFVDGEFNSKREADCCAVLVVDE